MTRHQLLIVLMGVAALSCAGTARAQTASSQSVTPQALQRLLQAPVDPLRDRTNDLGYGGTLACPTCMPGGYGPGTGGSFPQITPGQTGDVLPRPRNVGGLPTFTLATCAPVPLKVGPRKIGLINAGDQTLKFALKLGDTEQVVNLAPGEIETVTLPSGTSALAGTSDDSIPAQTLAAGKVYRLKAQNGKWAFVAD